MIPTAVQDMQEVDKKSVLQLEANRQQLFYLSVAGKSLSSGCIQRQSSCKLQIKLLQYGLML